MPEYIECYKVFQLNKDRGANLTPWFMSAEMGGPVYKKGRVNTRWEGWGPIAAFKTVKGITDWMGKEWRGCVRVCAVRGVESDDGEMWRVNKEGVKFPCTFKLLPGLILLDEFEVVRELY